jgi:hypothetical protein
MLPWHFPHRNHHQIVTQKKPYWTTTSQLTRRKMYWTTRQDPPAPQAQFSLPSTNLAPLPMSWISSPTISTWMHGLLSYRHYCQPHPAFRTATFTLFDAPGSVDSLATDHGFARLLEAIYHHNTTNPTLATVSQLPRPQVLSTAAPTCA